MKGKMWALMKIGPGPGAELREVDIPELGPDDILVRVRACSICGSDLHIYQWDRWAAGRIRPPLVFGHEFAGEVVAVGQRVDHLKVGQLVSAETHITCGQCYQCRTGAEHICSRVAILGVDTDGAFAEYVKIPARNAWPTPAEVAPEIAAIQEPFGNAVHTVLAGEVTGLRVAVLGCGPIGLMAVALCRAAGAALVIATDVNAYRLELAARMGAHLVLDATRGILDEVRKATHGEGVDVVLEMSGAPAALRDALRMARNGARVSLLGIPSEPVSLDIAEDVVFKGLTIQGISGRRMFETWYRTRALLASGVVDLSPLITHRFALSQFRAAFELVASGQCGKVVMFPQGLT